MNEFKKERREDEEKGHRPWNRLKSDRKHLDHLCAQGTH